MSGEKQKRLSRQEILDLSDAEVREVDIPEWGTTINLRTLTALEATSFAESYKRGDKDGAIRMLVISAVDEDGKLMFTEADIPSLQKKSMKVILRLQNAAMELNGLRDRKVVEEAAKNG